jgi:hypothetical protein
VKTCEDVQKEINDLRKKIQQEKTIKAFLASIKLSEQQKCDSESITIKCEKCECWKTLKENYS